MKRVLKILGFLILIVAAVVLIGGLVVSRDYHFERSITINAPQATIWDVVSRFSNFKQWSPWAERDPNMQTTLTGTDGTIGSKYSWKGNKEVGSGEETITGLKPMEQVDIDLNFKEPFESHATCFIRLVPSGNQTTVTWGFDTRMGYPSNFIMKTLMNMDNMMDKDFSHGLNKLKAYCETHPAPPAN